MSFFTDTSTTNNRFSAGFALIELMVAISIMVLITSVVIVRQTSFNSATLLENQAYEVAFDIRQTQLRAVSAQAGTDDDFFDAYGVSLLDEGRMYTFFRRSEGGSQSIFGAPGRLDSRFVFGTIETLGSSPDTFSAVDVVFSRPNFDAIFYDESGSAIDAEGLMIRVQVRDDDEKYREVEILNTGQITVR